MRKEISEAMTMELVEWMLSGQEGSITYVCMNSKDAEEVYKHAVDILKGILLKLRWEETDENIH